MASASSGSSRQLPSIIPDGGGGLDLASEAPVLSLVLDGGTGGTSWIGVPGSRDDATGVPGSDRSGATGVLGPRRRRSWCSWHTVTRSTPLSSAYRC